MGAALVITKTLACIGRGQRCAWITVARTAGSAPREIGARMLVTLDTALDTIGGGQLEYRAIEIARALIAQPSEAKARLERFPLSARVGQCCGGTVWLAIEIISPIDSDWLVKADASLRTGAAFTRKKTLSFENEATEWEDIIAPTSPGVVLFGAGHVGRAVATILSVNDVALTWIDSRDAQFPEAIDQRVFTIESDDPAKEVDRISSAASCLIMTHSHALDFAILEAILRRDDARFIGLIGSATKRAQFESRLRARGFSERSIQSVVCPIGVAGVASKHPGAIAASVVAQLLQSFEVTSQSLFAA